MNEEQRKNVEKWIKALRSGDYKQGRGHLKTKDGYCCIGVACEIMNVANAFSDLKQRFYFYFSGDNIEGRVLPNFRHDISPCYWYTFTFGSYAPPQERLVNMNDSGGCGEPVYDFNDIADYIEDHLHEHLKEVE